MKYILRLNIVSMIYALMVFIPSELMVNVYRIGRLTSWGIDSVNVSIFAALLIEIIAGTIFLYYLTEKWLGRRLANLWTSILWIPYYILLIYLFVSLFPITYGGDDPNPASGLFIFGGLVLYPLYILILNIFCITSHAKNAPNDQH